VAQGINPNAAAVNAANTYAAANAQYNMAPTSFQAPKPGGSNSPISSMDMQASADMYRNMFARAIQNQDASMFPKSISSQMMNQSGMTAQDMMNAGYVLNVGTNMWNQPGSATPTTPANAPTSAPTWSQTLGGGIFAGQQLFVNKDGQRMDKDGNVVWDPKKATTDIYGDPFVQKYIPTQAEKRRRARIEARGGGGGGNNNSGNVTGNANVNFNAGAG
jgi:hypothetical protein